MKGKNVEGYNYVQILLYMQAYVRDSLQQYASTFVSVGSLQMQGVSIGSIPKRHKP